MQKIHKKYRALRLILFITVQMFTIYNCAESSPKNFYQKHLRSSRTASGTGDINADKAFARLAAKISGKPLSTRLPPASEKTLISKKQLEDLISAPFSQESLEKALRIKNSGISDPLIDEYLALCYWYTGNNDKAIETGNLVIQRIESPKVRQMLFSQAINDKSFDLALHHLEKASLNSYEQKMSRFKVGLLRGEKAYLAALIVIGVTLILMFYVLIRIKRGCLELIATMAAKRPPPAGSIISVIQHQTEPEKAPALPATSEQKHSSSMKDAVSSEGFAASLINEISEPVYTIAPSLPEFDVHKRIADSEMVRTFFLSLQISLSKHMLRVISIASDSRTAKKALFALHLGRLFAEDDYKTLVLDCNNTAPFLHEELSLEAMTGVSDLADPDCELDSIFRKSEIEQLFYITSGKNADQINELSEAAWELMLDYCKKHYEIIIIILPELQMAESNHAILRNTGMIFICEKDVKAPEDCQPGSFLNLQGTKIIGQISLNQSKGQLS